MIQLSKPGAQRIETLLADWNQGEDAALATILELCYESHLIPKARAILKHERRAASFSPGDLIHQAWFRLNGLHKRRFPSMDAFLGFVGELMRRELIDFARKEDAAVRGGKHKKEIPIEKCQEWLNG